LFLCILPNAFSNHVLAGRILAPFGIDVLYQYPEDPDRHYSISRNHSTIKSVVESGHQRISSCHLVRLLG
jgi:hypothetical protein